MALYCNVKEAVIQNLDCDSVYELPLLLEQGLARVVCNHLGIAQYVERICQAGKIWWHGSEQPESLSIFLGRKYRKVDAYYSVTEALDHASITHGAIPNIDWVAAEDLEGLTPTEVEEI